MFNIKVERLVKKPIDAVFAAISDHGSYGEFQAVKAAELIGEGELEPNGLGALRKVEIGPLTLFERIVAFERPNVMRYQIESATPFAFQHDLGEVKLEAQGEDTLVTWKSVGHVKVPIIGSLILDRLMQKQGAAGFASILKAIEKA